MKSFTFFEEMEEEVAPRMDSIWGGAGFLQF